MEPDFDPNMTVSSYRRSMEGYLPYVDRVEWKMLYGKICHLEAYADYVGPTALSAQRYGRRATETIWMDDSGRPVLRRSSCGTAVCDTSLSYIAGTRLPSHESHLIQGSADPFFEADHAYDGHGLPSLFGGQAVTRDPRNHVTEALGEQSSYNGSGDLLTKGALEYTYLPSGLPHRLASATDPASGRFTSFSYSGANPGYPSAITRNGTGTRSLSLSYAGDLLLSASSESESRRYAYDSSGFPAVAYDGEGNVLERYAFEGERLLSVSFPGDRDLLYVYGPGGDPWLLVEKKASGSVSRYLIARDSLGRILRLWRPDSPSARVVYSYDAWGKPTVAQDTADGLSEWNRLLFKSYLYDPWLGAYRLGRRQYDPVVGRFWEPDSPAYLDPSAPAGLNPYAYCNNDPITYSDHSGHMAEWTYWAIGAGAIALLAIATVITAGIAGVGVGAAFGVGFAGTAIGSGAAGAAVTIASSAFAGAVIGAGIGMASGALIGGLSTMSWSGALSGAAHGFMWGSLTGAVSGGIRGLMNFATTTPLYRSVKDAELDDIKTFGFRSNGGAEGKYFWGTKNAASAFGSKYKQAATVGVRVSKCFLNSSVMYWSSLDSLGPAFYFSDIDYLYTVLGGMWFF